MLQNRYPPLNMHFIVQFSDLDFDNDIHFQSVQGLRGRICENEGGSGTHVKFDNLILRRAYQPDSKIQLWCMDAFNFKKILPVNLSVKLLNAQHQPISTWNIKSALPVAWGVDALHAQESKILIETIELKYKTFQISTNDGKFEIPNKKTRTNSKKKRP